MHFRDMAGNPISVCKPIIIGKLFAIAAVDGASSYGLVALFIEDDETYTMKCVFDRAWLPDLASTAKLSTDAFPIPEHVRNSYAEGA